MPSLSVNYQRNALESCSPSMHLTRTQLKTVSLGPSKGAGVRAGGSKGMNKYFTGFSVPTHAAARATTGSTQSHRQRS